MKNPDYPDTLYVDSLIGPDTINTMAEATITAFEDHGTLARTVDTGIEQADRVMHDLKTVGVDMDDVGHALDLPAGQRLLGGHAHAVHQPGRHRGGQHRLAAGAEGRGEVAG